MIYFFVQNPLHCIFSLPIHYYVYNYTLLLGFCPHGKTIVFLPAEQNVLSCPTVVLLFQPFGGKAVGRGTVYNVVQQLALLIIQLQRFRIAVDRSRFGTAQNDVQFG